MKGWKTWAGFVILVITSILKAVGIEIPGNAGELVGAGLTAIGIAHKLEKLKY